MKNKPIEIKLKQINKILGVSLKGGGLSPHLFSNAQWLLPTEEHYNILQEHVELKPYEEIKKEYDELKKNTTN